MSKVLADKNLPKSFRENFCAYSHNILHCEN